MVGYTGNGAYCFSNSLHMCLRSAGLDMSITPGLIECLGGMPFGAGYYRFSDTPMFLPSTPANQPDRAIGQVLAVLGWCCDESRAGSDEDAIKRLQTTALPAQAGPLDMGKLVYNPEAAYLAGADHYVTVLEVTPDQVCLHDPAGYPFATLSLVDFMQAWKAEGVNYGPDAPSLRYVLRANFRQMESVSRVDALRRAWTSIVRMLAIRFEGPQVMSGATAYHAFAEDIRRGFADPMRNRLVFFALPLGARRCADAALFLAELGETAGVSCLERKARLYGAALYHAVHREWESLAAQVDSLAAVESEFMKLIAG